MRGSLAKKLRGKGAGVPTEYIVDPRPRFTVKNAILVKLFGKKPVYEFWKTTPTVMKKTCDRWFYQQRKLRILRIKRGYSGWG